MKKQTSHKKSKDAPVKAKKAAPKKAAKKAAKKSENPKDELTEKKVEVPKTEPQPEVQTQQPEAPQPTPESIAPQETPERISTSDQQKLLFKYGARIDNTDLSGTKDEVLNKVFKKTGDSVEDIRKYLEG